MRRLKTPLALFAMLATMLVAIPAAAAAPPTCFGLAVTHLGDANDNVINGTPGDDVIHGRGGDDAIDGGGGNDVICGGSGVDVILGGPGHDLINGGFGADTIFGNGGRDALAGNRGGDTINGGGGRDVIMGGPGNDTMFGRRGADFIDGRQGLNDKAVGGLHRDICRAETKVKCEGPVPPFRLKANGIGDIPFGTATDFALVELALMGDPELEGAPDEDSGWIDSFSVYGTCPNEQVRMVRWGNVRTFFTRNGLAEGEFFTWQVVGFGGYEDKRLSTPQGLRRGDTRGQLELLIPNLTVEFVDPFGFWAFYAGGNPSGISGTLSDGSMGDEVTFLQGGIGCGE